MECSVNNNTDVYSLNFVRMPVMIMVLILDGITSCCRHLVTSKESLNPIFIRKYNGHDKLFGLLT